MDEPAHRLIVAVVGPCTAGKSTLTAALREKGYMARQPAQEHSYVVDMWERLVNPDVLIYLDVRYQAAQQRRRIQWGPKRLEDQARRLAHAREHADLYIDTTTITAEEVLEKALEFLSE